MTTAFLANPASGNTVFPAQPAESTPLPAMTFDGDFDAGNLHPTNSSITDATLQNPHMVIAPRVQTLDNFSGTPRWQQFFCRLDNVSGRTPTFEFDASQITDQVRSAWRPWYTYDDPESADAVWHRWDTATANPSGNTWTFARVEPFTEATVWIATHPAYPLARTRDLIAWLEANHADKLHALPSTGADWVADTVSGQTDDLSRALPAQPIRSYGIWDEDYPDDGLPKRIAVLSAGLHSGEHLGSWKFETAIRFLVSADPIAVALRKRFQIFCYPDLCPVGRYGGHYRGQWDPANMTRDPNRDWADFDLESTQKLAAIFGDDVGGRVVGYWSDFHSWTWNTSFSSSPKFYMQRTESIEADRDLYHSLLNTLGTYPRSVITGADGRMTWWAINTHGLRHGHSPESQEMWGTGGDITVWTVAGSDHIKALDLLWNDETGYQQLLVDHHLTAPTLSVEVISPTRNDLTWTAVDGATRYDLEINGTITALGDVLEHSDTDASGTRVYRVRGFDDAGPGPWSVAVAITTATSAESTWSANDATATALVVATATALSAESSWSANTATAAGEGAAQADAVPAVSEWSANTATASAVVPVTAEATTAESTWTANDATATALVAATATATSASSTWSANTADANTASDVSAEATPAASTWTANDATPTALVVSIATATPAESVWSANTAAATAIVPVEATATSAESEWSANLASAVGVVGELELVATATPAVSEWSANSATGVGEAIVAPSPCNLATVTIESSFATVRIENNFATVRVPNNFATVRCP